MREQKERNENLMKNGHWTDIFDSEEGGRNYGQILYKGVGIFLAVLPLLIRFGYSDAWMIPEFLKKYGYPAYESFRSHLYRNSPADGLSVLLQYSGRRKRNV